MDALRLSAPPDDAAAALRRLEALLRKDLPNAANAAAVKCLLLLRLGQGDAAAAFARTFAPGAGAPAEVLLHTQLWSSWYAVRAGHVMYMTLPVDGDLLVIHVGRFPGF